MTGKRGTLQERFWRHVEKTDTCWVWTGAKSNGYGRLGIGPAGGGYVYAHRQSYEWAKGKIPAGLSIDHLCRNPSCVNPDHLEPVTQRENTLRGIGPAAVRYHSTTCQRGHPFSPENTAWRGGRWRECITCRKARRAIREGRAA